MALTLKHTSSVKVRILSAFLMVFALMAQPMYSLVASQVANALGGATFYVDASNGSDSNDCSTGGAGACSTIQKAINEADNGDTINVASGTYNESLDINKHVSLIGSGAKNTTIVNATDGKYTIFMNNHAASSTDIKSFTLKNEALGMPVLKLADGAALDDLYITGNRFYSNNSHLIYAGKVSGSRFTSNTFNVNGITNPRPGKTSNNAGVYFGPSSDGNTFKNNKFTGNTGSMPFGIEGDDNIFLSNNLSALTTTYNKIFEVKGNNNTDTDNMYGSSQVVINPGSDKFRGVYGTITDAISVARGDDEIVAMKGTYGLPVTTIAKNLTIKGQGMDVTTILQEGNTGNKGWFQVGSGVSFSVKSLTLDGNSLGGSTTYYAIDHRGSGVIENVHLQNIVHGSVQGTGVYVAGNGKVDVVGSKFSNIGRNGALYNGNVTGDFTHNTYTGKGDGSRLDYALTLWYGAKVSANGNYIRDNTGIAGDGSRSSGFNVWDDGSSLTLVGNTIKNNTYGIAIQDESTLSAEGNDISGNDRGLVVYDTDVVANVSGNWWGDVTGPGGIGKGAGDMISAPSGHSVTYSPWLCSLNGIRLSNDKPNCYTPVVASVYPGSTSSIGGIRKIYINISNPEVMRGGFLQLNRSVESGNPLNSDRINYNLQEDENGWYALVDTTMLDEGGYLFKVEAHGTQTPWGYYGNNSGWTSPSYHFVVDNTAPSAPSITIPVNGQEFTATPGGDTIRSEWSEVADAVEYEIKYEYTRNNNRVTDTRKVTSLYRNQSLSGAVLSDFVVNVRAKDSAGNWSDWSSPVTYYYGVEAPAAPLVEPEEAFVAETSTTGRSLPESDDDSEGDEPDQIFTASLFGFGLPNLTDDADTEDDDEVAVVDNSGVLGEQDRAEGAPLADTGEVMGAMDHKLFGIAWYWYLIILGAIAGAWLLLAGATRRSNEEM